MAGYDLHMHSSMSDGLLDPVVLVQEARAAGIGTMALTDHDSLEGHEAAARACAELGVRFLPGVEVTAYRGEVEVHILGYFFRGVGSGLEEFLTARIRDRQDRVGVMAERLQELGLPVTAEEIRAEARGESVGRPHVARLLARKGCVQDPAEAFELYIGDGKPGYVPKRRCTPGEALHSIRGAGGLPVMAHPGQMGGVEMVAELAAEGLAGIEVYHPDHNPQDREIFRREAQRRNLVITGGSDFHGGGIRGTAHLGTCPLSRREFERIEAVALRDLP